VTTDQGTQLIALVTQLTTQLTTVQCQLTAIGIALQYCFLALAGVLLFSVIGAIRR
jgi:biotin transporter BioY